MNKLFLILLIITFTFNLFSQRQIGFDILGDGENDDFGSGLAINENGSIIAIGSQRWNFGQGIVEVFENINDEWSLLGNRIEGPIGNSWFGTDVELSPSGHRMVVGSYRRNVVLIYDLINSDWVLSGEITLGIESSIIHFGYAVDISTDGNTIAISATHYNSNSGIVNVYEKMNTEWIQIGGEINGEFEGDQSGWDIDLSENGKTIAIGSLTNNNNGEDSGQVRVFSYNNVSWIQVGQSLQGDHEHLSFGWKLSMSENGKYLVVGAPIDWNGVTTDFHYAEIFELVNSQWISKGDKIYGQKGESFGYDVEISEDGNRVVISVPTNLSCPIQVYDFIESNWMLVGSMAYEPDLLPIGYSIAMNLRGDKLIASSYLSNGVAIVYSLDDLDIPECLMEEIIEENEDNAEVTEGLVLFMPNIISTNTSFLENSILYAQSDSVFNYQLKVYDRWGNLLFENENAMTNTPSDGWSPGTNVVQGVFVYTVSFMFNSEALIKTGDITLLR